MNGLDLLILGAAVAAAVGGYRIGFVTRVISWLTMAAGILAAALALPWVLDRIGGDEARPDLVFVCVGVVLAGGLVGQGIGMLIGSRVHVVIPPGPARRVDAGVGAVAGLLGVALLVWLLAPAMADVPEWPARQARGSAVVGAVSDVLPRPPDATRSVRRLLGTRYPQVFDTFRRAPDLGPPPAASGLSAAAARRITASTVEVTGEACNRIQEGSGFVVGPDLVATNAHVVAGEPQTQVMTTDGTRYRGKVVAFDPERDLALVSVPGLDRPALPLATGNVGDRGAVFGHPGGGPLRLAPFIVGQGLAATGADIYDQPGVKRQILVLSSDLHPGDSGSALVTPQATVVGVAFAIAPDRPGVAYALATSELRAVLDRPHRGSVDTGACIS